LVGLDLLWQLGLTQSELQVLGAELGSDIPFSIAGGSTLATGRGETLDPLSRLTNLYVLLAKYESISVATPWAYQTYRANYSDQYIREAAGVTSRQNQVKSGEVVTAISQGDGVALGQALHNDLEKVVLPAHPQVAALREIMAAAGGLGTLMSGSGPTLFTLAESQTEAEALQKAVRSQLPDPDLQLWIAKFAPAGVWLDA
jgi:4-diphosphocytidyl-2-C-methyl-D-erythritol kinase